MDTPSVVPLLSVAVALVFGGCCSNAWSLERLLKDNPGIGTTLTFFQLVFITCQCAPACISWSPYPRFRPLVVPLRTWMQQVFVLTAMALLNNWAFAYRVPLTLQIVFRSAGLTVSMILGYVFLKRRYTSLQVFSVIIVTSGVILATLSRPTSNTPGTRGFNATTDLRDYTTGVFMLAASCVFTSGLGILQERVFIQYGRNVWQEGLFYTHLFSLLTFCFLFKDVMTGLRALSLVEEGPPRLLNKYLPAISWLHVVLAMNVITQSVCVSGANLLTSQSSAVTTNLILTARKALSLCISVWYFGQGLNAGLAVGATIVLFGTILYSYASTKTHRQNVQIEPLADVVKAPSTAVDSASLPEKFNGDPRPNGKLANGHGHQPASSTEDEVSSTTEPLEGISSRTRSRLGEVRRRGVDGSGGPTPTLALEVRRTSSRRTQALDKNR